MNLLEELTGRAFHERQRLPGRRYSSALPGDLAEEQRLMEQHAIASAEAAMEQGARVPASYLVLAALRDGRARFEGQIGEITTLAHETVRNELTRARKRGLVEQTHVGNFRLWSLTTGGDK